MRGRILILGGTGEAVEAAALLIAAGFDVTSSLAGSTSSPLLPAGRVRHGGFGGPKGLETYLRSEKIEILLDATHPFANEISRNAIEATNAAAIALIRLERPAWIPKERDRWLSVSSSEEAVETIRPGSRAFISIGRKEILGFIGRKDISGVLRMIEPPSFSIPENWHLVLRRPPFSVAAELALLQEHRIDVVVTKNSGGNATKAKLDAASELGLPVIMIERPCQDHKNAVSDARDALEAIERMSGQEQA